MMSEESKTKEAKGSCLCGKVSMQFQHVSTALGACHCRMCRKWGGSALLALSSGTQVTIEGEEHITAYSSSAWAERGFCKHCGTHLFYKLKQAQSYTVPLGFFEELSGLTFQHEIFIDEKPDCYAFAGERETMTGAEVFAKYGAG
ncbi:MAG: aldehyde-activating protein [Deltaproteobacteria bacterium]|nr:aldehyde-activating protein [Deltaproteobacteria bacterium]MBU47339.1 aldehyde-activating protein [Deltaproteobacteria bacterium]|tara:strand:+ start:16383 stop:16817 length:435 start_codon:yes stop_codon:yes gene_type:complete